MFCYRLSFFLPSQLAWCTVPYPRRGRQVNNFGFPSWVPFSPQIAFHERKSATWPWLKIHCYLAVAISGDWVRFLSLFNADVWFCKPSLYRTSWQHCSSNLPISSNLAFISWEHHPASFSFSWLVRQCGSHKYSTLRFFYCIHFHLSQRTSIWVRIYPNLCLLLYLSLL
jgi:hypothetical protein